MDSTAAAERDVDGRRGRYSDDGMWWWDDTRERWFRTTDPTETLDIVLEDHGHSSVGRSLITTLTGQYGTQSFRFVARCRGEVLAGAPYLASDTFPVLPLALAPGKPIPEAGWPDEVRGAHRELQAGLADRGWRPVATGEQWWATVYARRAVDWDTPPDAYEREG